MNALNYYIAQAWAVEGSTLANGLDILRRHEMGVRLEQEDIAAVVKARDESRGKMDLVSRPWDGAFSDLTPEEQDRGYTIRNGVAVVPIEGMLCQYASLINGSSQPRGMSSSAVIRGVGRAASDPAARAMVLRIDSPGGTVAGTPEIGQAIRAASETKPVVAFAAHAACSGAYWAASQASRIMLNATAVVGSIGVYCLLRDTSQAAAMQGVRFIIVKAGEHKGVGAAGVPITDSQVAALQQEMNAKRMEFVRVAASGRRRAGARMSDERMEGLADGRSHVGQDAVTLGLADAVGAMQDAEAMALKLVETWRR